MPLRLIVEDQELSLFDQVITTNLRGSYAVMAESARRLSRGGRIIAFSSSEVAKSFPRYGAYSASKAAVESLVHTLANELRGREITVNAVAPGPVATELFMNGKTQAQIDELTKASPLERLARPEDIVGTVSFLAGPDGAWVNSQVLRANGGFVAAGGPVMGNDRCDHGSFQRLWRHVGATPGRRRPHRLRRHARHRDTQSEGRGRGDPVCKGARGRPARHRARCRFAGVGRRRGRPRSSPTPAVSTSSFRTPATWCSAPRRPSARGDQRDLRHQRARHTAGQSRVTSPPPAAGPGPGPLDLEQQREGRHAAVPRSVLCGEGGDGLAGRHLR